MGFEMMLGDNHEWKNKNPEPLHSYSYGVDVACGPDQSATRYYRINSQTGQTQEISEDEYRAGVSL